ncbi:class I SAM-dependent methyltransferase [Blastococcus deserti]|uniref:Class I SAM-dependent methyltransferase n=1 Tax=Blastococcus deserti TaxID=2259033 RepID=A0ABW4X5J9_9ACTN
MTSSLVQRLASGAPLGDPPAVVDVHGSAPPNPPEQLQVQFVGLSFEEAYAEAEAFVTAVAEELRACGHPGLRGSRVLDFGCGWGRISRLLLSEVPPQQLFAVDVDGEMTALVNVSLPGINAMTVPVTPPTVLRDASMDVVVAFSVFSHLSRAAHEAWARELARVVRPGGIVAITVLGEEFIDLVEGAQQLVRRGAADDFAASMATVFADVPAARAGFRADRLQFGATGGGGVRTEDYYGWAAVPRRFVERVWGDNGMEVVRWRPSGELFSQGLVVLVRSGDDAAARAVRRARRAVRHRAEVAVERLRRRAPAPLVAVARRFRGAPGTGTGTADQL